jgi:hypothetical protein
LSWLIALNLLSKYFVVSFCCGVFPIATSRALKEYPIIFALNHLHFFKFPPRLTLDLAITIFR